MRPKIRRQEIATSPSTYPTREMVARHTLIQSHELTRTVLSKGTTWTSFKILLATVAQLNKGDQNLDMEFETTLSALCRLANIGSVRDTRSYQRAQDCISHIVETGSFRMTTGRNTLYIPFFLLAESNKDTKAVRFKLNPELKKHFINLRQGTFVKHVEVLLSLSELSQARLYMLACDCQHLVSPALRTFTPKELVGILGLEISEGAVTPENWQLADRIRKIHKALYSTKGRGKKEKRKIELAFKIKTIRQSAGMSLQLVFPPTLKRGGLLPKECD